MTALGPLKYRAFLSYAHADTSEAQWRHRQLERYAIDKSLVGAYNADRARTEVPQAHLPRPR